MFLGEINDADDIINILFNYVKENFDKFGHQEPNWWWHTDYGSEGSSSWSPFVETCFILYGEGEDRDNPRYEIFYDVVGWGVEPIKKFMKNVHCLDVHKYPSDNSDINLKDNGNYILSLEHSEDGRPRDRQLRNIFEEINKLKDIPNGFKVLISRPQPFDRWTNPNGYFQSIGYFKQEIQNKLMSAILNNSEKWLIILIAPFPDDNPKEIIFYCYEWNGTALHDIDEQHEKYTIPIKQVTKWVKVE